MRPRTAQRNTRLRSLIVLSVPLFAQAQQTVKQEAANSQCSNIVALAGSNVKLDCSNLNPAERKRIDAIPAVLNKILANQLDPIAVMEKLDEILHAVNPNAARKTYLLNGGFRVISPGNFSIDNTPNPAFKEIIDAYTAKDWASLARLCEQAMSDIPGWYTPLVFAGISYVNLGQKDRGIILLRRADDGMAGNPDYGSLPSETKRVLDTLR